MLSKQKWLAVALAVLLTPTWLFGVVASAEETPSSTASVTASPPVDNTDGSAQKAIPGAEEVITEQELPDFQEPEYTPQFTMPEELRAVSLTPGANFAANPEASEEDILKECQSILSEMAGMGMNSVVIDSSFGGKSFFTTDINESVNKTPLELAVTAAKEMGFFTYVIFDMNFQLSGNQRDSLQERIDKLALAAHQFTVKYKVDGILLDGYYAKKNTASFEDYMGNGSGIGFENWLLDNGAYVFKLVSDAIRRTDNTVPVGIYIKDVWANASTRPEGSNTSQSFEALVDGYADTLSYVKNGSADYMLVAADGTLDDPKEPFMEVAGWWGNVADEAGIPLFIMHDNSRIGSQNGSWAYPDQVVKQLIAAKKVPGYKGSAFLSIKSLKANSGGSTDALIKFYDNTLNLDTIDNELTINAPAKREFTTEEPSVSFQGSFDPNFTVTFNGKVIELSEVGTFYYEEPLEVGLNVFTIENKGKAITYRITRKITVLKSMEPTGDMGVEGGANIVISAVAYKGSAVSASIGGKSLQLKAESGRIEGDENSSYVRYSATYLAPKGIIGKEQDLGSISIYATYTGKNGAKFSASLQGARVRINALPEVPNNADGNLLRVKADNTMTYSYSTTSSVPMPNQPRLPAGTMDYLVKKVNYNGKQYYLSLSGKRYRAEDVQVLANDALGSNSITCKGAVLDGSDTILTFSTGVKSPYTLTFDGVSYSGENFSIGSFQSRSVTITFDYANSGSGEAGAGGMFNGSAWSQPVESRGISRVAMTLNLGVSGRFAGVSATYQGNDLVFRFKGYPKSLSGCTVVIDPGHGKTASGKIDPGGVGYVTDQQVALAVAVQLEAQLKSAGARVVRLPTDTQYIDTYQRSEVARQYDPDIYISLHGNKVVSNESVRGVEAYYFMPFSQPLAAAVSTSVASYYQNSVYKDGVNRNRGAKYDYFAVTLQHEFPSILLELGFVTNYQEAMTMADSKHQAGLASAIVKGIQAYMAR